MSLHPVKEASVRPSEGDIGKITISASLTSGRVRLCKLLVYQADDKAMPLIQGRLDEEEIRALIAVLKFFLPEAK